MSKVPQRNKPSKKQAKPHKQKTPSPTRQQSKKKFVVFVTIAILAAIPFSMGKYFEFNSPGPYDSGGYVYSAKHILDGAEIGIEEKTSARLGTLLANILGVWLFGFSETGPKLIQMILQAAGLALMFIALRKLFGTLAAAVSVIVASVYLSSPLIAKFGNVKEQYMIAFMILGVSCFVLRQLGGRWWYAVLAGAFASWAPLFKETGTSAIGAIGLFVVLQPMLKNRTWKQTGIDILLLLAGAAAAIGPLYVWIIGWDVKLMLPYKFAWAPVVKMLEAKTTAQTADATKATSGYITRSRELIPFVQQWPRVLRYYGLLILPIALAAGAIVARIMRIIWSWSRPQQAVVRKEYERFVLLFAVWWLLDMAFVWISPRSYEQYYLPLNASAAMLGAYLICLYRHRLLQKPHTVTTSRALTWDVVFLVAWAFVAWGTVRLVFLKTIEQPAEYGQYYVALSAAVIMLGLGLVGLLRDRLSSGINATRWYLVGAVGLACMLAMSWHVFLGIERSPHSGNKYGQKRKGYAQKLNEISQRRKNNWKGAWEAIGEYIRLNSEPTDRIYVWGWVPGIYVKAQRFSSSSKACTLPRATPEETTKKIAGLLEEFRQKMPKFIVDSRKNHIPLDRPPYELWPQTKTGFLPLNKQIIDQYDAAYSKWLRDSFDEDEALRYETMKSFREFVMKNYQIVPARFGQHVLFKKKNL